MKKILFNFIYIFLIIFPIIAYAEGIENYYINAIVEEDGDLRVREYYNMTGEYNGSIREINYQNSSAYPFRPELESYGGSTLHNGNGITINEIRAVKINSKFDFTNVTGDKFKKVESADPGDYGVYTTEIGYDGYTYKIFLPDNEEKARHQEVQQQRFDELSKIYDKSHPVGELTVDGQTIRQSSVSNRYGTTKVFESQNLTDKQIHNYAQQLAGDTPLKEVRPGIYTAKLNNGTSITLRNLSSSQEQTGARWTIDIKGNKQLSDIAYKYKDVEIKFK